jgi:hypothetical protein
MKRFFPLSLPLDTWYSLKHFSVVAALAVMAIAWTYPMVTHLSTDLPGAAAGDNVAFLWNFWWMRTALDAGRDVSLTDYLFAPSGVDLTLHTHTALLAFAGATVLAALPVIAALNVTVLVSVFLSGLAAYLLAWRLTASTSAAAIAGLIYGGSPFMSAHLNGHFNLTSAWTVPLFALAVHGAIVQSSTRSSIAAGLVLAITLYVDYYLFVFQAVLGLVLFLAEVVSFALRTSRRTRIHDLIVRMMAILIVTDLAVIAAVLITGGFTIQPFNVSVHSTFNPRQALWWFIAVGAWAFFRPHVAVTLRPSFDRRSYMRTAIWMASAFLVVAAPVIWKGASLVARGDYVAPHYYWRSAPRGVDLATLALGNPFHGLWGGSTRRIYDALDVDAIESSAWLGLVPAILVAWVIRRRWQLTLVRRWTAVAVLFFIWSLGPHLTVAGANTGLILPQTVIRLIPVLSNARIPGRAMVVVYLAIAVLAAVAVAQYRTSLTCAWGPPPSRAQTPQRALRRDLAGAGPRELGPAEAGTPKRKTGLRPVAAKGDSITPGNRARDRRSALAAVMIGSAIVADYLPAPFPLTRLEPPALYSVLRSRPERGAVCELPFGFRDGFGQRGTFDDRIMFHQTLHERPLVGGFVARLSPSVSRFYEHDPLLGTFLRLSGATELPALAPPDRDEAGRLLEQYGIRFLVVNRRTASQELQAYVERTLPIAKVVDDEERTLYVVTKP